MALTVMQTFGLMAAAHPVVPLGLLLKWPSAKMVCQCLLRLEEIQAKSGYRFWESHQYLLMGTPQGQVTSYFTLFMNAPLRGWWETSLGRAVGGAS